MGKEASEHLAEPSEPPGDVFPITVLVFSEFQLLGVQFLKRPQSACHEVPWRTQPCLWDLGYQRLHGGSWVTCTGPCSFGIDSSTARPQVPRLLPMARLLFGLTPIHDCSS